MEKTISSTPINSKKHQIYRYIYDEKKTSRGKIAKALGLSMPTVQQILKGLIAEELIEKNGNFQSTGGRKCDVYSCTSDTHIAIGAHIEKNNLHLVAVNLYGNVIKREHISEQYSHSVEYYRNFADHIDAFVKSLGISSEKIMGVGIALTALLSRDRLAVVKSVLLGTDEATLADFKEFLVYPCQLFHDSEAAARAELWFSPDIVDAVYLGLNNYLNGMLITGGKIHVGKEYTGGLVEHMILYPNGRQCYCGKKGCLTTYCSANTLFGSVDSNACTEFFRELRSGNSSALTQWNRFLSDLAIAIGSLCALLDCNIILGGMLGAYMTDGDVHDLQMMIRSNSKYAPSSDFISLGHKDADICACGAAMSYIAAFVESIA